MEKYSITEVIEQAVQTERLGYLFYTTMADRLKDIDCVLNPWGKELVHEKRFSELKEITGTEEPEGWEEASQYLRAIVESEFFLGRNKALPALEHVKSVEDAVNFAMGFEKETLLYFHTVRDVVREKDVVDEIINEEKSHVRWLSEFRENFKRQG
jgi:rubrerythrin